MTLIRGKLLITYFVIQHCVALMFKKPYMRLDFTEFFSKLGRDND